MEKKNWLVERWRRYKGRKSLLAIVLDFVLLALVVAMLFPSSRKTLTSTVIRYTLFQPREQKDVSYVSLASSQWQLEDMNGNQVLMSDLEGKVVFINFWATWCPPCIAEMPSIQQLYDKFGDKVVFLMVSSEPANVINGFLARKGYTLPIYHTVGGSEPNEFRTKSIPATFLLSKKQRVVIKKTGAAKWNGNKMTDLITKLLKEN